MSDSKARARDNRLVSVRVPETLYASLERDAEQLNVSVSDIVRMRLQTGRVPSFAEQGQTA